MASKLLNALGKVTVTVPAAGSVAIWTRGSVAVSQQSGFTNQPTQIARIGGVKAGSATFGPYTNGATLILEADGLGGLYEIGAAPAIQSLLAAQVQGTPVAVDTTGAVSAAAILGGIVTSSTAAAVAGTVPTGTVMDAASSFDIGDSVDWSVINTGPNTFTVTAATAHTLVGAAAVATATSGNFRTRKTAANTFVTYRLA